MVEPRWGPTWDRRSKEHSEGRITMGDHAGIHNEIQIIPDRCPNSRRYCWAVHQGTFRPKFSLEPDLTSTFNCEADGYNSIHGYEQVIARRKSQDTFHMIPFVALDTILSKGKNVVRVWR